MLEVTCPGCGKLLRVPEAHAGKTGRCTECGGPVTAPTPEGAPGYVEPAKFGHYSKAAEEHWEDPLENAAHEPESPVELGTEGIPEEVIRKHRERQRRKRLNILLAAVAASVILVLLAAAWAFFAQSPPAMDDSTPETPVDAPGSEPEPVQEAAPEPAASSPDMTSHPTGPPEDAVVYVAVTGTVYHRYGCSERAPDDRPIVLSDALAQGYGPCPVCMAD